MPINQLVKQISDRYIKQLSEQKSKLSKNTKNSSNQPDSEKKQVKFKLNPDEQIISDPNSYNEENNSLNLDFIRNIGDEGSNRNNREEGDMSNSLSLPNFSAEAADLDDTPLANLTPDEGKGRNSVTTTPNVPKHSNTNSHLRTNPTNPTANNQVGIPLQWDFLENFLNEIDPNQVDFNDTSEMLNQLIEDQ